MMLWERQWSLASEREAASRQAREDLGLDRNRPFRPRSGTVG